MAREDGEERRKRFFPTITLGNVIAIVGLTAGGVGVYSTVIADVGKTKADIARLEAEHKELKKEVKEEIKEVKNEVKELNLKIDRVLFEISRIPKPAAERIR